MARTRKLVSVWALYCDLKKVQQQFVLDQWLSQFAGKTKTQFYEAIYSPNYQELLFFAAVFEVTVEELLSKYALAKVVPVSQYKKPIDRKADTYKLAKSL